MEVGGVGVRPPPYPPPPPPGAGAAVAACSSAPSTRRRNSRSRPHASGNRPRTTLRGRTSASAITDVIGKLAKSMSVEGLLSAVAAAVSRGAPPTRRRRATPGALVAHASVVLRAAGRARLCARRDALSGASRAACPVCSRMASTAAAALRHTPPLVSTASNTPAHAAHTTGHGALIAAALAGMLIAPLCSVCCGLPAVSMPAPHARSAIPSSKRVCVRTTAGACTAAAAAAIGTLVSLPPAPPATSVLTGAACAAAAMLPSLSIPTPAAARAR